MMAPPDKQGGLTQLLDAAKISNIFTEAEYAIMDKTLAKLDDIDKQPQG
jgi:hypothetical protein